MFGKVACAVCVGLTLAVPVKTTSAADIVVMRGSQTEVVSTARAAGGVTVLRGAPGKQGKSYPERRAAPKRTVTRDFTGTGENLWHVDSQGRLRACWLTGTGYVNSLAIVCTQ
jgi:hypothetical protein